MLDKLKDMLSPKAAKERRAKAEMAKKLDGKALKCVTERINGIEEIIGRDGAILLKGNELVVYAGQDIVFRSDIYKMTAGELLSLEGVVLQADGEDGYERSIIAYYKYWRKMDS